MLLHLIDLDTLLVCGWVGEIEVLRLDQTNCIHKDRADRPT